MKIDQIDIYPYSIPFTKLLKTSNKLYNHREGAWIKIKSGKYSGFGEAAPLPGFSLESLTDVYYALEAINQAIQGSDFQIEELITLIEVYTENNPSTRFGIETAIFDLFSKEKNISFSQYLNPNAKNEILVNGIENIHSNIDNFNIIKVKVGFRNLFEEIEYIEKLTLSFSENVAFRLDANGAFDLVRAIRFCKEMQKFNIDYIEQPLPPNDLIDLSELINHTDIPIAVDESLTDLISAKKIIDQRAADIFIIKPMISGGFVETDKIVKLANSENIRTLITSSLETSIGVFSCLHIAAACEIKEACGLATSRLLNNKKLAHPEINEGVIRLKNVPGIGIELA